MPYVQVDVDLEDFETDELCEELIKRFKEYGRKQLTEDQKKEIRSSISDLVLKVGFATNNIELKSVEDKMKIEFLSTIWNKYTYWQLEEKLSW